MTSGLVRLAILAYPSRWRRRYGAELQELTIMVLGGQGSVAERMLTLSRVTAYGLVERLGTRGSRVSRTALACAAALVAAGLVLAGGLADIGLNRNAVLSPAVHIGAGVSVSSGARPDVAALRAGSVVVELPHARGGRISVVGAPSEVVIDPASGEVASVTRLGRRATRPRVSRARGRELHGALIHGHRSSHSTRA